MAKKYGLYVIQDYTVGKAYIGSSVDLDRRMREHNFRLNKKTHPNIHLQKAYNREHKLIGVIIPVDTYDRDKILSYEQELLNEFVGKNNCYNIAKDATAPGKDRVITDEYREKCRIASLGRGLGLKHSTERINKNRLGHIGLKQSEETIIKRITNPGFINRDTSGIAKSTIETWTGRKHTEESKQKQSVAAKLRDPLLVRAKVEAMSKAVSIPVTVNDVQYLSISDAAKAHGIDPKTAKDRILSNNERFSDWKLSDRKG